MIKACLRCIPYVIQNDFAALAALDHDDFDDHDHKHDDLDA